MLPPCSIRERKDCEANIDFCWLNPDSPYWHVAEAIATSIAALAALEPLPDTVHTEALRQLASFAISRAY